MRSGGVRETPDRAGVEPEFSVVVPARNATATIRKLFAALDRIEFDRGWEVVVVDDASTDGTGELAREWGARVVRLDLQSGPAASRNAGIADARAPVIAFTDADCEPLPGWLAGLARAFADADLVTGPILPTPDARRRPFDRTLRVPGPSPLFETANLAVRKDLALAVGGFEPFSPSFGGGLPGLRPSVDQGHFGEDAVFGWRVRRAGGRYAFAADAIVHHAVFPRGARGYVAERWRLRFFPALVRAVPELRSSLTLRFFLSRRSALFDAAVVGVVAATVARRPGLLVAIAPYATRHLHGRRLWRRSVARRNAALVIGDAVGLAALLRGSVAARRLLL